MKVEIDDIENVEPVKEAVIDSLIAEEEYTNYFLTLVPYDIVVILNGSCEWEGKVIDTK